MKLLLDTHVLLWWADDEPTLSVGVRDLLESSDAEIWMSAVSMWEVAIKHALGKLKSPPDVLDGAIDRGARELPINWQHGRTAGSLPLLHTDPFDRLLVAQAQIEGLSIVTRDALVRRYDVHTVAA